MRKLLILLAVIISICFVGVIIFFVGGFLYNQIYLGGIVKNSKKINSCYLEHNDSVYYYSFAEFYILENLNTKPQDFKLILNENCLAKNNTNVFIGSDIITGADPTTYTVIDADFITYGKDKDFVYFNSDKIDGADVRTFNIKLIGDKTNYSTDIKHVYYDGKIVDGLNPQSFTILNDESFKPAYRYIKDSVNNNVYFDGVRFNVDGGTFNVIDHLLALSKDDYNVYYKTSQIPGLQSRKLQILAKDGSGIGHAIVKDESKVFYLSASNGLKEIKNVDAKMFRQYKSNEFSWTGSRLAPDNICGDTQNFFYCTNGNKIDNGLVKTP